MINEDLNFNNIKNSDILSDWKFVWMSSIIPQIEKECLFPIPGAEVEQVNFIDNTNVEIQLKSDDKLYKDRFNNPYFKYKFCVRFLSMTRSKNPEYHLEYYWTGGPQDYGRMFWIGEHMIDYFTNNEHYKIKIDKITNLYEVHMCSNTRGIYNITPAFSLNLRNAVGKATQFVDVNTLEMIRDNQHKAFSILYDIFERVYTSDKRQFWFDNEFYVAGCWVKRGENHEKTGNRIHESVDFNNVQNTSELTDIFTPIYAKQIICKELPIFFGEETKVEYQSDKSISDNDFIFHEMKDSGGNRLFYIRVDNIDNDGKVHIKLFSRDIANNAYFTQLTITDSMIRYLVDPNSNIVFDSIVATVPNVKINYLVLTEKIINNKNVRQFFANIAGDKFDITTIYFDSLITAANFIYFYTADCGGDIQINKAFSNVYVANEKGKNIMPEVTMDLLQYPSIIGKSRIKGGSNNDYCIWLTKDFTKALLSMNENNKYKNNNILNEMINDTPYYIGNTEQMNNALAQANKDEATYAKNNFARQEFIRKVLGNKLYNDILDLGATGTFAPIPLNMIRLTHDDFKKFLKTNGLLDTDDVIIKLYNIIRQAYVRYLFREVNGKIDTDIVFKTFDEVIDFFQILYHALEKVFLKRVILEIDLKWKPITNKFRDYLA